MGFSTTSASLETQSVFRGLLHDPQESNNGGLAQEFTQAEAAAAPDSLDWRCFLSILLIPKLYCRLFRPIFLRVGDFNWSISDDYPLAIILKLFSLQTSNISILRVD